MLARWIATVAALLLACAQASAHVRSERAADLGTFAAGTEHALEIERSAETASPSETASHPKTAPPARASLENPASGENALLTHCHAWENWSPLKKCASGVDKYLYGNGNPGSFIDPEGRCGVGTPGGLASICGYFHTRDRVGLDVAQRQLQQSYPATSMAIGAGKGTGRFVNALVTSPFETAGAFAGSVAERFGLRDGTASTDQLGRMVQGGLNTAEGVYQQGPIDYASLKLSDKMTEVRGQYERGEVIEASANATETGLAFSTAAAGTGAAAFRFANGARAPSTTQYLDTSDIDAQMYSDAAPRERMVVENAQNEPMLVAPGTPPNSELSSRGRRANESLVVSADEMLAHLKAVRRQIDKLNSRGVNDSGQAFLNAVANGDYRTAGTIAHNRMFKRLRSVDFTTTSGGPVSINSGRVMPPPGVAATRGYDYRLPEIQYGLPGSAEYRVWDYKGGSDGYPYSDPTGQFEDIYDWTGQRPQELYYHWR